MFGRSVGCTTHGLADEATYFICSLEVPGSRYEARIRAGREGYRGKAGKQVASSDSRTGLPRCMLGEDCQL